MPKDLPLPPAVVSRERHCTGINFILPIGKEMQCVASFTERETFEDGTHYDGEQSSVTLTQAEIAALPAFAAAYGQLSFAVHAKRSAYDT